MSRCISLALAYFFTVGNFHADAQTVDQKSPAAPASVGPALPVYPLDCAVDSEGMVFVVDRNLPGIWKWDQKQLSIFSQGSKRYREPLNAVRCIALDRDGQLLVGDSSTREIYRLGASGEPQPLTDGQIGIPMDIAVKSDGTIYVADLELRRLVRIPAGSKTVETVADVNPRGVFVDHEDQVWVVSQGEQQLQIVPDSGTPQVIVGQRVFEFPHHVVVNQQGEAFVSDGYKKAIWKVKRGEQPEIVVQGAPLENPVGLSLVDNQVVVTDPRAAKVFRLTADNKLEVWFEIKR